MTSVFANVPHSIEALKAGLPTAQFLHRAIFTTGTTILKKRQVTHLRAFRMCVVKDTPDAALFNHPGALTKLALWIGEALAETEYQNKGRLLHGGRGTPLVAASLDEKRGVYVVVGTGGGGGPDSVFAAREAAKQKAEAKEKKAKEKEAARIANERIREAKKEAKMRRKEEEQAKKKEQGSGGDEEEDTDSEDDDSDESEEEEEDDDDNNLDVYDASQERGYGLNKFGTAFQDVVAETNARVRIDSFEHCVVEVKKEDLSGFLESLSMKAVVG